MHDAHEETLEHAEPTQHTAALQRSLQHRLPSAQKKLGDPSGRQAGTVVVVVELEVVEVDVVVTHAPCAHASQQLGTAPTQAWPPRGATHFAVPLLIAQEVRPALVVRQQVTKPGLPHVDLLAHRLTALAQLVFASTRCAWVSAQRT
jgi:hypothetical protein